jgi:DnaJ-domain-containing protein 1
MAAARSVRAEAEAAEAAATVALALALQRAPAEHADLLHGRTPLPAGVVTLLKLAGGSPPNPACAALAPADSLQAAALGFVEQVLLRHDASHYRVLGVEPAASPEQIKEHHRLLMRVFHPDREQRADDWKDAFATRINLAYTTLRDADARRRYDATLHASRPAPRPPVPRVARPARTRPSALPPWLMRHLPQWVLAGSAAVAALAVGAVYLGNRPPPAAPVMLAAAPAPAPTPAPALSAAPDSPPPAAPPTPRAAASRVPALPQPPVAPQPARAPVTPSPAPTAQRTLAPSPAVAPQPSPRPAPVVQAAIMPPAATVAVPAAAPAPLAVAAQREPAVKLAVTLDVPAAPAVRAPEPPRPAEAPRAPDPNATLARFMASYERGDTQAFMALFDEVAISRSGGKTQIRREHEALFRSTDLRHIAIEGMNWTRDGDWIRGEGRYRATQMKKGELQLHTESGLFRIQLAPRGDAVLIMGLDYQPAERS